MSRTDGQLVHIVTLQCKDADNAANCINALATYGRPDAEAFGCLAYEFGLKEGTQDTVHIVERWTEWADLDRLLTEKVVPALPLYNQMLLRPFDPGSDTLRIRLA